MPEVRQGEDFSLYWLLVFWVEKSRLIYKDYRDHAGGFTHPIFKDFTYWIIINIPHLRTSPHSAALQNDDIGSTVSSKMNVSRSRPRKGV